MRHAENPGIVRTIYLGIFRHVHGHSRIFNHVQPYWGTLRQMKLIQALLRHIELYSDIFRTLCNPCIYNNTIFRILTHLQPEALPKVCQTCKMIRHIQNLDIDAYSATLICVQLQGRGEASGVLFRKSKKVSWFWKKDLSFVHLWVVCCPPVLKNYFCKTFHLKCLTVFWICLCLNNCSIVFIVMILVNVPYQTYSEFCQIQNSVYSGMWKHIQGILSIIKAYSYILKHY